MFDLLFSGYRMYLIVLAIHIVGAIIARSRIYLWEKTSKPVKCIALESKLYKMTGRIDSLTLTNHYPLKIYKMQEKQSGKIRYLMLNNIQGQSCKKGEEYNLFVDKTWNMFLPTKDIPRLTKMIMYLNVFSSYILWLVVCALINWLFISRMPDIYSVYFNIVAFVFVVFCLVKYIIFNFCTVNFYWKAKYQFLNEEKVKKNYQKKI